MFTTRKGWSIIEVLIATIIIGVLVAIFIPSYRASIEQSHCATAMQNLRSLRQAEISFYATNQQYTNNLALLGPIIGADLVTLLPPVGAGEPWGYSIGLGATTFTLTAQRNGGRWNTNTITLNEIDQWGGTYPIDGPW